MKNTSGANKGRPSSSAVRKGSKGKQVGSGGQGRQALEGKKPTPAAEDRPYHPAGKAKAARERLDAARGRAGNGPRAGSAVAGRGGQEAPRRRPKSADDSEMVTGRNSVLEALRTRIPASTLYIAARIEMDDRTKEILQLATRRGLPVLEVMRPEIGRAHV